MKIARGMEPFAYERALIIACGESKAKLHFAHQGFIDYLGSVVVPAPKFSDREGFFMSTARGMVFRAGAVYENQKEERHKQFIHELVGQVERHVADLGVTILYVFCPEHARGAIVGALEKRFRKLMLFTLRGYRVDEHPFALIHKIEHARNEAFDLLHQPCRAQEKKLLRREVVGPRSHKIRKKAHS